MKFQTSMTKLNGHELLLWTSSIVLTFPRSTTLRKSAVFPSLEKEAPNLFGPSQSLDTTVKIRTSGQI